MNFSEALQAKEKGDINFFLVQDFLKIRAKTLELCTPLLPEDYIIQTIPDVSPPKWHLAHSTWFFETFLLSKFVENYQIFNEEFPYLFNSYYKGVGKHYLRTKRGLLSRPPLKDILNYRHFVEEAMAELLEKDFPPSIKSQIRKLTILGLHHEQQHQELLLTDIKHILATQPSCPAYQNAKIKKNHQDLPSIFKNTWKSFSEGLYEIGYPPNLFKTSEVDSFSFDNERPRHRVWLDAFALSEQLVTNKQYLEFIQEGGYQNPLLWLSEGWDWVLSTEAKAPLYWQSSENSEKKPHLTEDLWWQRTLLGKLPLNLNEPVCHLNYYEADAFARWAGKRLPREAEWEIAAAQTIQNQAIQGHFLESENFHPQPADTNSPQRQLFGEVWQWTQSAYLPYPGFQPEAGLVGEYNGKFMCNQMVLKGGSCFTPQEHFRISYRNFFPASAQWQMTGLRLARDL